MNIPPLNKTPLSGPVWLWVAYCTVIFILSLVATSGGFLGFACVLFTVMLSFQFWVFVTHRGLSKLDE